MSLINEALKKAQNQRTVESTSVPLPYSSATGSVTSQQVRIAKRPPPLAARTLIGLLGGGLFGLLAVGVVSLFYFSASTDQPSAVVAKSPLAEPSVSPAPLQAKHPIPVITPSEPIISVSLPAFPGSSPSVVTPPAVVATPPSPPPAPAVPTTNPKISEFIEALRISVVRATPTDPKVVVNGQVLRLNDWVDRSLQVRLVKIEASRLVFVDANGFEYIKSL